MCHDYSKLKVGRFLRHSSIWQWFKAQLMKEQYFFTARGIVRSLISVQLHLLLNCFYFSCSPTSSWLWTTDRYFSSASPCLSISASSLHFAWVVDDAKCIVVTRVCVCVCLSICLSAALRPHYCTDPDITWGHGRGCPLVVHYWADLQSGHGLRCYGSIMWTLVTSLRPSRDMTT